MKKKIPIQIIELEKGNFHLIATSTFIDETSGNWAIDTGASKTVFDKNLEEFYLASGNETEEIHSTGIGENTFETTIVTLKKFWIGKFEVENLKVALIDLSHINKIYHKETNLEICGLIGGDFLMKYKALIDYKKRVLILNL